jgi:hypothetical protein
MAMALLCVSGAFVLGLNAASAEELIPETPAGRTMSAWLEAFRALFGTLGYNRIGFIQDRSLGDSHAIVHRDDESGQSR